MICIALYFIAFFHVIVYCIVVICIALDIFFFTVAMPLGDSALVPVVASNQIYLSLGLSVLTSLGILGFAGL